jgi:hypothetical protein
MIRSIDSPLNTAARRSRSRAAEETGLLVEVLDKIDVDEVGHARAIRVSVAVKRLTRFVLPGS